MKRSESESYQRFRYGLSSLPYYPGMLLAKWGLPLNDNDRKLNALTNRHTGEKAVIIGMGPSLRVSDLERFRGVTAFACNKIYLAFNETSWRPQFYSVSDKLVAENNAEEILATDFGSATPIHNRLVKKELARQPGALFFSCSNYIRWPWPRMPRRLGGGLMAGGSTVCIDMIQMAYAMGFSEVYLVGIDFSFTVPDRSLKQVSLSGPVLQSEGEINHFHKDYRAPGETWTVPSMEGQRQAFATCRTLFEKDGRKIINASRKSKLEVLERAEFECVFPPT